MISCVITICDKDYQNIYNVIKSIKDSVSEDYEILIMDNREKKKNINLANTNARIIDMGGNKFEFEARKRSVKYATGDYIWFIDGDDKVIGSVPTISNADLICFNYKLSNNGGLSHYYGEHKIVTDNLFTLSTFQEIGNPVWAKLIKRKFLDNIYSKIHGEQIINLNEDATLLFFILYYASSVEFRTETCYEYNIFTSVCEKTRYDDISQLKNLFTGCEIPIKILNETISFEEQEQSELRTSDLWRNNLLFMRDIYLRCEDNIKEPFVNEIMLKYYSEEEVRGVL